jgi:hypothetical protein
MQCHRTIVLIALMVLCCDLLTIAAVASAEIQQVTTRRCTGTAQAASRGNNGAPDLSPALPFNGGA